MGPMRPRLSGNKVAEGSVDVRLYGERTCDNDLLGLCRRVKC